MRFHQLASTLTTGMNTSAHKERRWSLCKLLTNSLRYHHRNSHQFLLSAPLEGWAPDPSSSWSWCWSWSWVWDCLLVGNLVETARILARARNLQPSNLQPSRMQRALMPWKSSSPRWCKSISPHRKANRWDREQLSINVAT